MKTTTLLPAILACVLGFCSAIRAQDAKPADVTFNDYGTISFVRGQAKDIKVSGKNLSVQSIETIPSGGVELREAKEFFFDPKSHISMRKGYKMFTLTIGISEDAQAGDRMMYVVTPEGRSKPHPITIRDHVPVISNLQATVVSRSKKDIRIDFDFTDNAGDISSEPPPAITYICDSLFSGKAFGGARTESITMKDQNSGSITATLRLSEFHPNICFLWVALTDKNGNKSDEAGAKIEFK